MDLEMEIKEEPVWLEGTGSIPLDTYISDPVDNYSESHTSVIPKVENDVLYPATNDVMKLENFELVSGMTPVKQETKSELTEPGPSEEHAFEVTEEVKHEIFIEEHAVEQAVSSIEEENKLEKVSVLTLRPVHSCDSCSRSFKSSSTLKRHLLLHTREGSHRCTLCSKTFSRRCFLIKHKLTHSGERPYRCLECNKTFARKFTLDFHLLTHSEERPFSCAMCRSSFNQKSHLNIHLLTCSHKSSKL